MDKHLHSLKGIVFINQTLSMGGAENFNSQLMSWFFKQGIPVKAWTTFEPLNAKLRKDGIEARKTPVVVDIVGDWKGLIKGIVFFPFALIYYSYLTIKNRKNGTFYMTGYIEKIIVTPIAKLLKIPVVWMEFGPLGTIFSKFLGMPKILYRWVSMLPDYVIEPSRNTVKSNRVIGGFRESRVVRIPNSIKPLRRIKTGIVKHTAFCVSRMERGKGQDLLVRAWPKVVSKYSDAKLYFIGEGDFRLKVEKIARSLNLGKSVKFLGWVKNLEKTIAPMSVAVFPSVWEMEGMSLVFMEAMSISKPIICFKWGSNLDLVDSKSALMVPKGDVAALTDAIIRLFSEPSLGKQLGQKAKERYKKYFTLDKVASKFSKVFLDAQLKYEK